MTVVSKSGSPTPTPAAARQAALSDIAHAFDDMEKSIEGTYGKPIDEAKKALDQGKNVPTSPTPKP